MAATNTSVIIANIPNAAAPIERAPVIAPTFSLFFETPWTWERIRILVLIYIQLCNADGEFRCGLRVLQHESASDGYKKPDNQQPDNDRYIASDWYFGERIHELRHGKVG